MFESHLNAIEKVLLAQEEVASNAGHPNLIGGPKEWFVRNFLADHLPSAVRVGQGEIIDSRSKKSSNRNQVDVILYRYDFPKIVYSKNDCAFLRESVIATIEVKSNVNKGEFRKACKASISHKNIQYIQEPDPKKPIQPIGVIIDIADLAFPTMSSYVVAFDGPAKISTAAGWLPAMSLEFET
ncbi:MAG: hypothetical protein GY797_19580, partial [Deltaproteobacteria bacterium]|nr:hypothetical protein [Deltaproteobacteria bacterium]